MRFWLAVAVTVIAAAARADAGPISIGELPAEAGRILRLIKQNGPFPFARDGAVFANREGRLPKRERGYYREYTVKTPGERERGPRRIVAGRGGEYYYSDDHYRSFRRIIE